MLLNTITLQSLKTQGSKAIPEGQTVYLIVNSKPKAVLVPPEEYVMLLRAFEELEDIAAIEERRAEKTVALERAFPNNAR